MHLRYDARMTATGPIDDSAPLDVLILGAGISGIGMAAHLVRNRPGKRFLILERRERLGGTWDLFRYPGVRSDSDMYTLGYGFKPWTGQRSIAHGEEILAYLRQVVDDHALLHVMRFGEQAIQANWDSKAGLWTVTADTADGPHVYRARFLFSACGYYDYDQPHDPKIPGLSTFRGAVLHPQFWPQDFDPSGKRIAVIGSGATAVTLLPALVDRGAEVTMIQRTPSWFYAESARDRTALLLRRLLPARWAYALIRARNTWLQRWFYQKARRDPAGMGAYLLKRTQRELGASWDEAAFKPPYGPWMQRLCFIPDGDLFTAIRSGKARIVTGGIETVTTEGVRLEKNLTIPADAIVTATGLRLQTLGGLRVCLDGTPIDFSQHWYYRNCMFSNVPNFAAVFGYLNAAWTARVDMVAQWLCRVFAQMDAWGANVVLPRLGEDHALEEADALAGFNSGYLERGRDLIPKSATHEPWRLNHDVLADLRTLREAPVDDGILTFLRVC